MSTPSSSRPFSLPVTTPTRPLSLNPPLPSSVKGWSPARPTSLDASPGPRRTSSSFKHVKTNSLVSNSPFKTSPTKQQQGGEDGLRSGKRVSYLSQPQSHNAIQSRFSQMAGSQTTASTGVSSSSITTTALPVTEAPPPPPPTSGHTRTPSIGLGIIADTPPRKVSSGRKTSGGSNRKISGGGSGSRIRSTSSTSPSSNSATKPRQVSGGALTPTIPTQLSDSSLSSHLFPTDATHESPDSRSKSSRAPRHSMGLNKLAKTGLVSRSPFLSQDDVAGSPERRSSPAGAGAGVGASGSPRFSGSPARYTRESTPVKPEREDVFSGPSPAAGEGYRASPLSLAKTSIRGESSDSLENVGKEFDFPLPNYREMAPPPSMPLPSPPQAARIAQPPTPTPTKSSITSRRLLGPRVSGVVPDSPSKGRGKTVTFREGPVDVKEFEVEEGDSSRGDGSFLGSEEGSEDIRHGHGSMMLGGHEGEESSPEMGEGSESMTGNFLDSLMDDGYLSPPNQSSESPDDGQTDVSRFLDASSAGDQEDTAAFRLDTPSMGGSLNATPLAEHPAFFEFTGDRDRDAYGMPYGRTHHLDRAVDAHSRPVGQPHLDQPGLPREGVNSGEPMLRNANAAEPSIYGPTGDAARYGPGHAHQDGGLVDPFVTIQTATKTYISQTQEAYPEREEDGVPLGRSSHSERAKVARLMATQSLGLGMPRRPTAPAPAPIRDQESEDGSFIMSDTDEEDVPVEGEKEAYQRYTKVQEANKRLSWERVELERQMERERLREIEEREIEAQRLRRLEIERERESNMSPEGGRRSLPKPPKAMPVDLPEPVKKDAVEVQPASISPKKFGLSLPFSLPAIINTSPLFSSPAFPTPKSDPSPVITERPSTPPPAARDYDEKRGSRHHIPDFDFEDVKVHSLSSMNPELTSSQAFRMVEEALPPLSPERQPVSKRISMLLPVIPSSPVKNVSFRNSMSDFGPAKAAAESGGDSMGSGSARVRQRISRDMIRQKMEEKKALSAQTGEDENLAAEMSMVSIAEKVALTGDKALPAPPAEWLSTSGKSSTTSQSRPRPTIPGREQSLSAQEVLQKAQKEGTILNPKSALDRLVSDYSSVKLDQNVGKDTGTMRNISGAASSTSSVPALPPKDQRVSSMAGSVGFGLSEKGKGKETDPSSVSSRRSRRSLSTGDARRVPSLAMQTRRSMIDGDLGGMNSLNDVAIGDSESMLHAFEDEVRNMNTDRHYKIRESQQKVYARADDKVKHNGAGDIDKGRAWRQLRRASDMNEYAKELRALKSKDSNSNKAFGTIFVKVLGIESLSLPIPSQPTAFCITLDNGIDYIRTPYVKLIDGARVNQEFALVEHANFEFALGLEIRRDPHIIKMHHANINAATLPQPVMERSSSATGTARSTHCGAIKSFFQSPRKASKAPLRPATPQEPAPIIRAPLEDNICRYFGTGDSTVGRTHIAFQPIAKNCDAKILEIRYPMFGMYRTDPSGSVVKRAGINNPNLPAPPTGIAPVKKQVGKITLQIFRLPPLPGLKQEQLPQSIDECLRGMRHHAWHEHEYLEGTLTQRGGDCYSSKRRMFKLIGGNLVATNAVTKKDVISVDLRKATAVEDNNAPHTSRLNDEGVAHMARSFRLTFVDGDYIDFAADTEQEKSQWFTALSGLIGKIPSNPLWAELLAAKQRAARAAKVAQLAPTKEVPVSTTE